MKKSLIILGTATAAVAGWAGVAGAQTGTGYSGDEENPAVVESELPAPSSTDSASTNTAVDTKAATQTLPVTGSNTMGLALAGAVLVAGGGALVWRSRVSQVAA